MMYAILVHAIHEQFHCANNINYVVGLHFTDYCGLSDQVMVKAVCSAMGIALLAQSLSFVLVRERKTMALIREHRCPTIVCGQKIFCDQHARMDRHTRAFADSRISLKRSRCDKLLPDWRDLNAYHGEAIINKYINKTNAAA